MWLPLHERTAVLRRTARAHVRPRRGAGPAASPARAASRSPTRASRSTARDQRHRALRRGGRPPGRRGDPDGRHGGVGRAGWRSPPASRSASSPRSAPSTTRSTSSSTRSARRSPPAARWRSSRPRSTPLSCLTYLDLLRDAGLPEGWAVGVPCPGRVAEHLVTSPLIRFFSFIGSGEVGWGLRSRLAAGVRCGLEHGGSAPMIVDASADLDRVVPMILKGGYYHAGQVCVSVQRVFALDEVKDALVGPAVARPCRRCASATPWTPTPRSARSSSSPRSTASTSGSRRRVAEGAKLATGGHPLDHQCYAPTLAGRHPAAGPGAQRGGLRPGRQRDRRGRPRRGDRRCNELPLAFQAAVCTQDVDRALDAARRIDATAVMINDHTAFRVDWMPFGGRGPPASAWAASPTRSPSTPRPRWSCSRAAERSTRLVAPDDLQAAEQREVADLDAGRLRVRGVEHVGQSALPKSARPLMSTSASVGTITWTLPNRLTVVSSTSSPGPATTCSTWEPKTAIASGGTNPVASPVPTRPTITSGAIHPLPERRRAALLAALDGGFVAARDGVLDVPRDGGLDAPRALVRALDLDLAHQRVGVDRDDGRAGRGVAGAVVTLAHERKAAQVDLDVGRHGDRDLAHDRGGGDGQVGRQVGGREVDVDLPMNATAFVRRSARQRRLVFSWLSNPTIQRRAGRVEARSGGLRSAQHRGQVGRDPVELGAACAPPSCRRRGPRTRAARSRPPGPRRAAAR